MNAASSVMEGCCRIVSQDGFKFCKVIVGLNFAY